MLKPRFTVGLLLLSVYGGCGDTHKNEVHSTLSASQSGDNDVSTRSSSPSGGINTSSGGINTPSGAGGNSLGVNALWNDSLSLSTGIISTCALTTHGDVMCWGGTVLDGASHSRKNRHVPTKVEGISDAVQVSAGDNYSCAVTAGGNVGCWTHRGRAKYLHEGSSRLANIVQISIGIRGQTACALTTRGGVKCWWSTDLIDNNGVVVERAEQPWDVLDQDDNVLSGAAQVVVGREDRSCILTAAGGVKCWGSTFLGNGTDNFFPTHGTYNFALDDPFPVDVVRTDGSPLTNIVQISAGTRHTCALTSLNVGGKLMCWGSNLHYHQLGHGKWNNPTSAVEVVTDDGSALSGIVSVAAGRYFTCAIDRNGAAWCWGSAATKANNVTEKTKAERVSSPPTGFARIAAGYRHACGLAKSTGTSTSVYCWGLGGAGQVGIDPSKSLSLPPDEPFHFAIGLPVPGLVVPHRRAKFGCNSSACILKVGS